MSRKRKGDNVKPSSAQIRTTNKANKQAFKLKRQETRAKNRTDRVGIRADKRSNVVESKAEAREVAYENGIDPNAAMWQGISSLGQSVGGAVSSVFGGGAMSAIGGAIGGAGGANSDTFGVSAPGNDVSFGGGINLNDKGESVELNADGTVSASKNSNLIWWIGGGLLFLVTVVGVTFGKGKKRR